MKSWRSRGLLLAGAASLLIALPALSQETERPESLLPPGFGDPDRLPEPEEPPRPEPTAPEPAPAPAPSRPSPTPGPAAPVEQEEQEEREVRDPELFLVPDDARRPVERVGVLAGGKWGLGANAFGGADGRFLAVLMRRLDTPLASRWTSILLRRALLSRTDAPPGIDPVTWVAERAALLLRMGEADAARMLVQAVDTDRYNRRMIEVAARTALANADVGALCPLVRPAAEFSDEPIWPLSEAMCAALEGEAARASALIDQAQRRSGAEGIDRTLAEKVVGAGTDTRRAATVKWDNVDRLTPWRFGLASATGMEIPDGLIQGASPAMQAWFARAPMVPLEQRLEAAATAASLGVFSSTSLLDIYGLLYDRMDPSERPGTVAARLRTAYGAASPSERLEAIRSLWQEAETPVERHAARILTAGAAARIPPAPAFAEHADALIAAMLSAGMDRQAARWAGLVRQGEAAPRAAALLAVGAPGEAVPVDASLFESMAEEGEEGRRRAQMLLAGLAGLGRISGEDAVALGRELGIRLGREDRWTRAIDNAARNRQPGTIALLAGVGMQTADWRGVPPRHLFRIVRALRAVGLEYEARMIAAEAVARL